MLNAADMTTRSTVPADGVVKVLPAHDLVCAVAASLLTARLYPHRARTANMFARCLSLSAY